MYEKVHKRLQMQYVLNKETARLHFDSAKTDVQHQQFKVGQATLESSTDDQDRVLRQWRLNPEDLRSKEQMHNSDPDHIGPFYYEPTTSDALLNVNDHASFTDKVPTLVNPSMMSTRDPNRANADHDLRTQK